MTPQERLARVEALIAKLRAGQLGVERVELIERIFTEREELLKGVLDEESSGVADAG